MTNQFGPKRPVGVTVVAVLAMLGGIIDIIGGILLALVAGDAELVDQLGGSGLVITIAIVSIAVGVAMIIVAIGLLRGNAVARITMTALEVLSLLMSIYVAIVHPTSLITEIVSGLIAIAIIMLLWSREATRFFRGLAPDEPIEP